MDMNLKCAYMSISSFSYHSENERTIDAIPFSSVNCAHQIKKYINTIFFREGFWYFQSVFPSLLSVHTTIGGLLGSIFLTKQQTQIKVGPWLWLSGVVIFVIFEAYCATAHLI